MSTEQWSVSSVSECLVSCGFFIFSLLFLHFCFSEKIKPTLDLFIHQFPSTEGALPGFSFYLTVSLSVWGAQLFFFLFFGVSPCHDRDFSQLGLLFELLLIFTEKGLRDLHVFTFYLHFKKKKKGKGHKEKTPICLDGPCFLLFTNAVFKPRSQALGCDPSLETQSQLLASAHPWLPASRDVTKEACSQTRRAVRGAVTRYSGVQQFPIEGNHSKGSPGPHQGVPAPAVYTDIIALWGYSAWHLCLLCIINWFVRQGFKRK